LLEQLAHFVVLLALVDQVLSALGKVPELAADESRLLVIEPNWRPIDYLFYSVQFAYDVLLYRLGLAQAAQDIREHVVVQEVDHLLLLLDRPEVLNGYTQSEEITGDFLSVVWVLVGCFDD
jgi:hypothetical protein